MKYAAIVEPNFIDIVVPVLEKHKNSVGIVIGPNQHDQWAVGHQKTQGRLLALGRRDDTALFYEAADIYVDSFPFTSNTSLLEAGNYGLPLVSYCPHASDAEVLCAGAPGLTQALLYARNSCCFDDVLSRLINNPVLRLRIGESTRDAILAAHCGEGWQSALQSLYRKALTLQRESAVSKNVEQRTIRKLDILLNELYPHFSFSGFVEKYIRPLPITIRIRLLVNILKINRTFSFGMLLPLWLENRLSGQVEWRQWPGVNRWLGENMQ
jgi:hypothetical protein